MTTNLKIQYPEIPFNAQSLTHNLYSYVGSATQELVSGPRYRNFSLTQSTYSDLWLNIDMGSGNAATASILSVLKAKLLKESGVNVLQLTPSNYSALTPNSISNIAAWYDATKEVTTDSNGCISQWNDLSGNARHLTQATITSRPRLTRADNKENLVPHNRNLAGSTWALTQATLVSNDEISPTTGRQDVDLLVENTATSDHYIRTQTIQTQAGKNYRIRGVFKTNNPSDRLVGVRFLLASDAFCYVFLDTGTIWFQTGTWVSTSVTSLGNGWYEFQGVRTETGNGRVNGVIDLSVVKKTTGSSYLGDGVSGVWITDLSVHQTDADNEVIETRANIERAGVNGCRAAYFEANDRLDATFSLTQPFTMLLVCREYGNTSAYRVLVHGGSEYTSLGYSMSGTIDQYANPSGISVARTRGNVEYFTAIFNGASSELYANGTLIVSGTVGAANLTGLRVGASKDGLTTNNHIGEILELILYNGAIGTTDRQAIEGYFNSKYLTTPTVNEKAFDTITLNGPNEEDYVSSFTTTSAVRYFWLHLSSTKINSYDFSKIYLGNGFDFGRDPVWGRRTELNPDEKGSRTARYKYSFDYEDITDAVVQDFLTKIVSKADVNPVVLVTGSYHDVLNDDRVVHCKIKEFSYQPIAYNQNNVSLVLEELI